jgi:glutaminase
VSPPLDDAGNSVRAQKAIADISNALGGNPLAPWGAKAAKGSN